MTRRSPGAIVGALGILKAGAAYLPLDRDHPADRIGYLLVDAKVAAVVTDDHTSSRVPAGPWEIVSIDSAEVALAVATRRRVAISPADLAYIMYTSGSTGRPKEVEVTHANLAHLIDWHVRAFQVTAADRASQVASLAFDAAVWEVWPYLSSGASVHFAPNSVRTEPEALRDWMLGDKISIGFVPTALAEHMIAMQWPKSIALRYLLTGADTLHRYPPANLPFHLVNNYGPTECTVVSTSGVVSPQTLNGAAPAQLPLIGRAIAGATAYVLDEHLQPVAPGATGELFIGGAGVARGYLNLPDLTREKFLPDPFSTDSGTRMYRTGDLAHTMPDGQLAFLGRADNQIKLRGYRIEPEEITSVLTRHAAVRSAVVTAPPDAHGEKQLLAYLIPAGARASKSELAEFLRATLPEYMIPRAWVWLEKFPLTTNGKIDYAALPEPAAAPAAPPAAAMSNATIEPAVTEIVKHLLGLDRLGRDENFFLLGGHSLLGAQMIVRLRKAFAVDLTLRNMFESPTVASLTAAIESRMAVRDAAAIGATK